MAKKMIVALIILIACVGLSCASQSQDMASNQIPEEKSNYLTDSFTPELSQILFEKERYEYEVKYHADYYLMMVDGQQDLVYYETFFIYEKDMNGNLINCKTVMITEPEFNTLYMEEYLLDVYGENYKYTKPYDNVYVHVEDISN